MAAPLDATPASSQRRLPAVHTLLAHADCLALIAQYGREQTTNAVRAVLDALRAAPSNDATPEAILRHAGAAMARDNASNMRPLYNLTGTVLHTNLI